MIIAYLVLVAIAITLYALFFRLETDWLEKAGIVSGVIATIIAVIALQTVDNSSGGYVTYVNGVRTSAGLLKVSSAFALFLIFGAISMGLTRGIGYWIGHRRDFDEKQEPKVWVLVLSIIGLIFGPSFLQAGFMNLAKDTSADWRNTLVIVLGFVIFGASIWGIVDYSRKKKRSNQR